jgi:hypothetical protein
MTCQRGSAHGRLQVGILGAIKSECLGDFIGIGSQAARRMAAVRAAVPTNPDAILSAGVDSH